MPQKIVLLTCVKAKKSYPCAAKDMYQGELFFSLMAYAKNQNPAKIFILSGKYGLLELDQKINPYDVNLNEVSDTALQQWSAKVVQELDQKTDLKNDRFILLCNSVYRRYISKKMTHIELPITID